MNPQRTTLLHTLILSWGARENTSYRGGVCVALFYCHGLLGTHIVRKLFCELMKAAQGSNNRTLAVHERVDSRFLVLPGSE